MLFGHNGFGTLASWTACDDGLMTALVDDTGTYLTLITLFPNTPNKFSAVGAESRLPKEGCHELVTVDLRERIFSLVHVSLCVMKFDKKRQIILTFYGVE